MRTHSKLILRALATSALLALAVSGASARSLRVSERNFELIWNEAFGSPKTKLNFTAAGRTISCRVTLLGRFNESTIKKETLLNQGSVNHGELETCTNGTATIRTETMPWIYRYNSFGGSLPRISHLAIRLIGATFRVRETGGLACEAASEVNRPARGIIGESIIPEFGFAVNGEPENITAEPGARIPLSGSLPCELAGEAELTGLGLIRNLPRTAKLSITLI